MINRISTLLFILKELLDMTMVEYDRIGFSGVKLLSTVSVITLLVFFTENYFNAPFNVTFYAIIFLYFGYFVIRNIKGRLLPAKRANSKLSQFQKTHYKFFKKASLPYPGLLPKGAIRYDVIECFLYKRKRKAPYYYPDILAIPIKTQKEADAEISPFLRDLHKENITRQKDQFYFWNDNNYHFTQALPSIKHFFVKNFGDINFFDENNKVWFDKMFKPKKINLSSLLYHVTRLMWIGLFVALVQFFGLGIFQAVLGATGLNMVVKIIIAKHEKRKLLSLRNPHQIYPQPFKTGYGMEMKMVNARILNQVAAPIMLSLQVFKKGENETESDSKPFSVFNPEFIQINTQADEKEELYYIDYAVHESSHQKPIENKLVKQVLLENNIKLEDLKEENQFTIEEKLKEKIAVQKES